MSELDTIIISKLEKVEGDISDIKVSVAKNTVDLEHHIKRTDDLQEMVEGMNELVSPIYQEHLSRKAVEDYKKKSREDLIYKLKLPGYIVAALAAIGAILAWFGHK